MTPKLFVARRVPLFSALVLAATVGCGDSCCTDPVVAPTGNATCNLDTECNAGSDFRFGGCVLGGCAEDSECCPGTRCRADLNVCFPVLLDDQFACEQSSDCQDPGQRCIATTIGAREALPTCVYELCSQDADCGFGRACYAGRCVVSAPCGGSCPAGTACDLITGTCATYPAKSAGCDVECGDKLKVFSDPPSMSGERCCALACECKVLPPLVPSRFGRYSRVAVTEGQVLVSAYDAQFGDLVVARYKLDGSFSLLQYVDGVPVGAAVVADPLGPRGGIAEPGPNVGTHTSIAADVQGLARIAYRDEDSKALKVAIEQPGGTFSSYVLDTGDADGSVGQFTDTFVDAGGTIYISYMAHHTALAGVTGKGTGAKLARSRVANPTSAADWDILTLDARPVVDAAAVNLPAESPDFPRGRGLYTSVALDGATAVVAYYDVVDGDLRVASVGATGAATVVVVDGDGQGTRRAGDVGRYPAVSRTGNNLTIVYEDFGRHEVRAWQGALTELGNGGTYSLVDRGQDPTRSGKHFVGAGARLARGVDAAMAVYQDASDNDLKFASFDGSGWVPGTLIREGAHGYYSDIAIAGGKAYIVSVEARLDDRGIEASRLGLTVQPVP